MKDDAKRLSEQISNILRDKKARDVVIIDISQMTILADAFVICSATSLVQARALCDELDDKLSAAGVPPLRREGYDGARWIVLDYGGVLVHIFNKEEREFYNIERLWSQPGNSTFLQDDPPPQG